MNLFIKNIETPIGNMIAMSTDAGICLLQFEEQKKIKNDILLIEKKFKSTAIKKEHRLFEKLEEELKNYFHHKLISFSTPLDIIGTDFQVNAWNELLKIPYGSTISYQQQANNIKRISAVRAVANANGRNKISIIIPCHRVISSNGSLGGYTGGTARKRFLLELETSYQRLF